MEYVNRNEKISEESGWLIIKNMKYKDLLKAYFNSNEFLESVEELSKKESIDYMNSYHYFASTYINFFLGYHPKDKKDNQKEISISYQSDKKKIIPKETQNSNNNDSKNNNDVPGLMIPLPSNFPQYTFETVEEDIFSLDSFYNSKNDDYGLIKKKSFFNEENNIFGK